MNIPSRPRLRRASPVLLLPPLHSACSCSPFSSSVCFLFSLLVLSFFTHLLGASCVLLLPALSYCSFLPFSSSPRLSCSFFPSPFLLLAFPLLSLILAPPSFILFSLFFPSYYYIVFIVHLLFHLFFCSVVSLFFFSLFSLPSSFAPSLFSRFLSSFLSIYFSLFFRLSRLSVLFPHSHLSVFPYFLSLF